MAHIMETGKRGELGGVTNKKLNKKVQGARPTEALVVLPRQLCNGRCLVTVCQLILKFESFYAY